MNGKVKSIGLWRVSAIMVMGAFLALSTATADASTAHASPVPGLTTAQAQTLQAEVHHYLHEFGGTQIAANEIRLPGDADLLLVLPGQKYAHHLTGARGSTPDASVACPDFFFCAYGARNYEGSMLTVGGNGQLVMPWATVGSYINNLGYGDYVSFLGYYGENLGSSCTSYHCAVSSYSWSPVYFIKGRVAQGG
jgi:hypothetical protein